MLRAQLAPGTRCALEHGGVAPVIVAADADLDANMARIAKGGFYHASQVCVSVQRVFADRSIAEEVGARLAELAGKMVVGDPTKADTEVGPLIRHAEADRGRGMGPGSGRGRCQGADRRQTDLRFPATRPRCFTTRRRTPRSVLARSSAPWSAVYPVDSLDGGGDPGQQPRRRLPGGRADPRYRYCAAHPAPAQCIGGHGQTTIPPSGVDWMPFAGLRHSGHGVGGIHHTVEAMQIQKMLVFRSAEL